MSGRWGVRVDQHGRFCRNVPGFLSSLGNKDYSLLRNLFLLQLAVSKHKQNKLHLTTITASGMLDYLSVKPYNIHYDSEGPRL